MKFLKIFLILQSIHHSQQQDADADVLTCNQELITAYNLVGLANPVEITDDNRLIMCNNLEMSCCTEGDQLKMYNNWSPTEANSKPVKITEFYQSITNVNTHLLEQFEKIQEFAQKIYDMQKEKQQGNCKFLAERILSMKVDQIKEDILKSIRKLEENVKDYYKGFYCSICDFNNKTFFNTQNSSITMSDKFCHKIKTDLLSTMLYFYHHFPIYTHLAGTLINNCTHKGEFILEKPVPAEVLLPYTDEVKAEHEYLLECRDERNELEGWLSACSPLCAKYNFVNLPSYFDGHFEHTFKFVNFSHKRLKEIEEEAAKKPEMDFSGMDDSAMLGMGRVLDGDGEAEGEAEADSDLLAQEILDKYHEKRNFIVFPHSEVNPSIANLSTYSITVETGSGVNTYDVGLQSAFNAQNKLSVQQSINPQDAPAPSGPQNNALGSNALGNDALKNTAVIGNDVLKANLSIFMILTNALLLI